MKVALAPTSIRPLAVAALVAAFVLLSWASTEPSDVLAGEAGGNCSSYAGGVCEIAVGDIWFCDASFRDGVCETSIQAGDTVRWDYPASAQLVHTVTACGADCDAPTPKPLWDSELLQPGDSFERTFTEPGEYLYYCNIHPTSQRGIIRVLGAEPALPSAPTDLEAHVVADALSVDLSWQDNADNEASYVVERATTGEEGPWAVIATLPVDSSSYFDTGLEDGVTYWYRVAAQNGAGMSQYSNIVSGTATALPAPPLGDVNCDGNVNSIDAALILQLDAGLIDSLTCQQNADANGDGNINSIDAALILQLDAGLIASL